VSLPVDFEVVVDHHLIAHRRLLLDETDSKGADIFPADHFLETDDRSGYKDLLFLIGKRELKDRRFLDILGNRTEEQNLCS
jgi:hypothetical protein